MRSDRSKCISCIQTCFGAVQLNTTKNTALIFHHYLLFVRVSCNHVPNLSDVKQIVGLSRVKHFLLLRSYPDRYKLHAQIQVHLCFLFVLLFYTILFPCVHCELYFSVDFKKLLWFSEEY